MKQGIMKNNLLYLLVLLLCTMHIKGQNTNYSAKGIASFYADKFEGRTTANGEVYYHSKKTAAHRTLPFGSIVKVTNLENNKVVVVRINDRGPFVDNRIIDLSKSAAKELEFIGKGLADVKIEVIASIDDIPDKIEDKTAIEQSRYYKLEVHTAQPKGKGVQIGSFGQDDNVFRLAERLKSKYAEEIFIEPAEINGKRVFRVIIGNYTHENQLQKLKTKLAKEYPDCFIVVFK
ncbi:MAG TPA: septal ring lytic transglycosylase RlpA family protein [Bacteroidales bacterium]|nr:septal ring lytic transglycosylase RlpA family protein [Bacteroidales bacterium]